MQFARKKYHQQVLLLHVAFLLGVLPHGPLFHRNGLLHCFARTMQQTRIWSFWFGPWLFLVLVYLGCLPHDVSTDHQRSNDFV